MSTPSSPQFIPSTIDDFVLNTTLADYQKKLVDNAYNANTYTRAMNGSKKLINGGGSIVESLIESQQDNGGFYLGADVLNTTQNNTLGMVEYKWQNLYEPIVIERDEERQNFGDEHRILDLVATKTMLSEKAIAKRLEQALTVDVAGSNNLYSLSTIINTGTLGTIAGATDTFWQATVTASGTFATQGLSDMATMYYAISSSSIEDNPTLILTTTSILRQFEQTRLPLERISNTDMTYNVGARNFTFKGVPITDGNYVSSGNMYFINANYVNLYVDTMTDFITTPFITPTNKTVRVSFIIWRGNHGTNNRRRLGKLTGIS